MGGNAGALLPSGGTLSTEDVSKTPFERTGSKKAQIDKHNLLTPIGKYDKQLS